MFTLREKFSRGRDDHHAAVVFESHSFNVRRVYFKSAAGFDGVVDQAGKCDHRIWS